MEEHLNAQVISFNLPSTSQELEYFYLVQYLEGGQSNPEL